MATELFKVTCVTCQASLSVRNPALVDQIVACPKCDSMVHVVPPALSVPAPEPVLASVVEPVATTAPAVETPSFEEAVLPDSVPHTSEAAEVPATSTFLEVGSASNATFIMWAVGSFVIGVTVMGALLMLRGDREPPTVAPQVTAPTPVPSVPPATIAGGDSEIESAAPTSSPGDIDDQPADDDNPFAEAANVEPQPEEPPLLGPVEQPAANRAAETVFTNKEGPVTPPQSEPAEKLVIGRADEPRVARKFDPLAIDPEEFNLADLTEGTAGDEAAGGVEPADDDSPAAERPVNAVVPVRLDPESGHSFANRLASLQLKRELPAIEVKDMPLLDFVALASQLSGVPVSVGPEQLQMAGRTPGRPVSASIEGATLAEVLETVFKPLHLEITTTGPQIVIVRQGAAKVRTVDYPVDDLLGDNLTAADVGRWIEQLIAPETWQAAGGDGTITATSGSLKIEQAQDVQYQILFLLERVRLAKGLPLRSKYPARLLSGKPYEAGIADRLGAPATFTFSHKTPLAEVFHYWQGEAGLPIFVDWPALATVDLWPDSRITCTSANEPWRTAFDKILAPLDLAWRAAPGGAIQITSRARADTEPVVDIYPTGTWHGDVANAVVIDDPVNGLTYVRAPAAVHKD